MYDTLKIYVKIYNKNTNIHSNYLTSWNRVFEKLMVTQLVKKFPTFYGTWRFHFHVHKSLSLDPTLSQMNPAYLPTIHSNIIFPSMLRSSKL